MERGILRGCDPKVQVNRATISSIVTSGPEPMPGHGVCRLTASHICGDTTFSAQNGQVPHWRGRAA